MEKKNMVLLTVIAVATLLVAVVGATFAYFSTTAENDFSGGGTGAAGNTNVGSGNVGEGGDTVIITETSSGAGSFTATNVYPGHREVAQAHVNAKNASGQTSNVKITYTAETNDFSEGAIKVSVYKSTTDLAIPASNAFNCVQETTTVGNEIRYTEDCTEIASLLTEKGATQVGTTQTLNGTDSQEVVLVASEPITADADGADTYFYIVVEFAETSEDQNADMSKTLDGSIKFELV